MIGLFFPIMCFVVIGYEHCIANMFFIPLGMLLGCTGIGGGTVRRQSGSGHARQHRGRRSLRGRAVLVSQPEISGRKFPRRQGRGSPARNGAQSGV